MREKGAQAQASLDSPLTSALPLKYILHSPAIPSQVLFLELAKCFCASETLHVLFPLGCPSYLNIPTNYPFPSQFSVISSVKLV